MSAVAAETFNPLACAIDSVTPVRESAAKAFEEREIAAKAARAAKQHSKPAAAAKKASEASSRTKSKPTRRDSGVAPCQVRRMMEAELQQHAEAKRAKYEAAIAKCTMLAEGKHPSAPNPTAEDKANAEATIASLRERLKKHHRVHISSDTPDIFAVFLDLLVAELYNVAASNTRNCGKKLVSLKHVLLEEHFPEVGGVSLRDTKAYPFVNNMPAIVNYKELVEEIAAEKAQKEAEKKARKEAGGEAAAAEPPKKGTRSVSFAQPIRKIVENAREMLSEDYKGLSLEGNFSIVVGHLLQQVLHTFVQSSLALLSHNNGQTITSDLVATYLLNAQRSANRTDEEIDSLRKLLNAARQHKSIEEASQRQKRQEREKERLSRLSAEHRNAIEAKKAAIEAVKAAKASLRAAKTMRACAEKLAFAEMAAVEKVLAACQAEVAAKEVVLGKASEVVAQHNAVVKKAAEEAKKAAEEAKAKAAIEQAAASAAD